MLQSPGGMSAAIKRRQVSEWTDMDEFVTTRHQINHLAAAAEFICHEKNMHVKDRAARKE